MTILASYGIQIPHADCLSRLPTNESRDDDINLFDCSMSVTSPITSLDITKQTTLDKVSVKVLEFTKRGWPNYIKDDQLKTYFNKRNELVIENECLLWGNRIVIPYTLRETVLNMLHDRDIGMYRMQMLARPEVWSPLIDSDIEEYVRRC